MFFIGFFVSLLLTRANKNGLHVNFKKAELDRLTTLEKCLSQFWVNHFEKITCTGNIVILAAKLSIFFSCILDLFPNDGSCVHFMSGRTELHWSCSICRWLWSIWRLFCVTACYHNKWYCWTRKATCGFRRLIWSHCFPDDIWSTAGRYMCIIECQQFMLCT